MPGWSRSQSLAKGRWLTSRLVDGAETEAEGTASKEPAKSRLRDRLDRRERDALLWSSPAFELVQELLLGLLAKPMTAVDATRPERRSQLVKRGYPKLVVQRLGPFRADSRQLDQVHQPSRHARARLLKRLEMTRLDHTDELLARSRPIPGSSARSFPSATSAARLCGRSRTVRAAVRYARTRNGFAPSMSSRSASLSSIPVISPFSSTRPFATTSPPGLDAGSIEELTLPRDAGLAQLPSAHCPVSAR
jgi:hypothetical protein